MKQIHSLLGSKVVALSLYSETGEMEIELEDEIGATDILIMKVAAIHVGSCAVEHETAEADFGIIKFNELNDVFKYLMGEIVCGTNLTPPKETEKPEKFWVAFHPSFYNNNSPFKHRLEFTFDVAFPAQKEDETCFVAFMIDIIESNYEFYV